jgi:hypothetical protein
MQTEIIPIKVYRPDWYAEAIQSTYGCGRLELWLKPWARIAEQLEADLMGSFIATVVIRNDLW